MPRLKKAAPKYRKHKQSGQAIVTLNSRDFLLVPYDSNSSCQKYDRLISEWLDRGRQPEASIESDLTVAELSNRYWSHAQARYTRNPPVEPGPRARVTSRRCELRDGGQVRDSKRRRRSCSSRLCVVWIPTGEPLS